MFAETVRTPTTGRTDALGHTGLTYGNELELFPAQPAFVDDACGEGAVRKEDERQDNDLLLEDLSYQRGADAMESLDSRGPGSTGVALFTLSWWDRADEGEEEEQQQPATVRPDEGVGESGYLPREANGWTAAGASRTPKRPPLH